MAISDPAPVDLSPDEQAARRCEFIEQCVLFEHLCQSQDTIYRTAYCYGDYKACERRRRRLQGISTPDDLMPSGYRLQPDGTAYPGVDTDLKRDTRPVEIVLLVYWMIILGLIMASSVLV